jgi:hypothetical protein
VKVYSLYKDFFSFLDKTMPHRPKWPTYFKVYYHPHQDFLESYFSSFPSLDSESLRERVERIKEGDYSRLRNLVAVSPPEALLHQAYQRCRDVLAPNEEPQAYLFIGFFSPDGFVMTLRGKPVICFGLERFKDLTLMRILFAHEYAHFLMRLSWETAEEEADWKSKIMAEGLATKFSLLCFPDRSLASHFLVRRDVLNWCQANESLLREIYNGARFGPSELLEIFARGKPELGIPVRAGKYLAFRAVEKFLGQKTERIKDLLEDKNLLLSLFDN